MNHTFLADEKIISDKSNNNYYAIYAQLKGQNKLEVILKMLSCEKNITLQPCMCPVYQVYLYYLTIFFF